MVAPATFPHNQRVATVPVGTKTPFNVTVNDTADLIIAANPRRSSVVMQIASGTVFLGNDATVSPTLYIIALAAGMVLTDDDSNDAWYGVTAAGSVVVHGCEVTL